MATNPQKLLFEIGVASALISLYLKVNVPELKEPASIYFDLSILALVIFYIVTKEFHGKFSLK